MIKRTLALDATLFFYFVGMPIAIGVGIIPLCIGLKRYKLLAIISAYSLIEQIPQMIFMATTDFTKYEQSAPSLNFHLPPWIGIALMVVGFGLMVFIFLVEVLAVRKRAYPLINRC